MASVEEEIAGVIPVRVLYEFHALLGWFLLQSSGVAECFVSLTSTQVCS